MDFGALFTPQSPIYVSQIERAVRHMRQCDTDTQTQNMRFIRTFIYESNRTYFL